MKNRTLPILLALVLVLGMFPTAVFAAEGTIPEGLSYYNCETYIEIASYTGSESVLEIPAQIEGLPVTKIGYFFQNCPTLTQVILPGTIEYIASDAFTNFPKLERISFSNRCEMYAAQDGVLFSGDMTELIRYPAAKEGRYTVPNSVTYIGGSAFDRCTGLTALVLPEGYSRRLDNYMFYHCSNLKEITIPAGVSEICDLAFSGCSSLTSINVDENNSTYRSIDGVLFNKEGTILVIFPGGISGHYVIPENVRVSHRAFYDKNGLTKVTLSNNVTYPVLADGTDAWGYIFYNCPLLTEIDVDPANPYYAVENNILYTKDGTSLLYFPQGRSGVVEIPEGVEDISYGAFLNARNITGIVLPTSLKTIWPAFNSRCENLTDVYYAGSEENWNSITIFTDPGDVSWDSYEHGTNNVLFSAAMHYNVTVFDDVPSASFYYEPVLWAVANQITNGISAAEFGPAADCNRAQVVTFLWRAAGCPEPNAAENPFVDVQAGSFYEKAVLWAVEKGITNGTDATHFSPTQSCNRAAVVTFLHRAAGSPAVESSANPFTDVPAESWYTAPVLWAVENGITNGMSAGIFGVDTVCNRAQIVTFLYRAYND